MGKPNPAFPPHALEAGRKFDNRVSFNGRPTNPVLLARCEPSSRYEAVVTWVCDDESLAGCFIVFVVTNVNETRTTNATNTYSPA